MVEENHLVNSCYNEGLTRAIDFLFLNTFDFLFLSNKLIIADNNPIKNYNNCFNLRYVKKLT